MYSALFSSFPPKSPYKIRIFFCTSIACTSANVLVQFLICFLTCLNNNVLCLHSHVHSLTQNFVVVQSLSRVWLFVTPWTAACQAPLSSTISQSLLKFMSIELVMLSNHLILCCPILLFAFNLSEHLAPFPMSQFFTAGGQSFGASASASVLPMNIQRWFPLGLTGLISLLSKGLSRVFSTTTSWKHHFLYAQSL